MMDHVKHRPPATPPASSRGPRGPRSDGLRTRAAVLDTAAQLSSTRGLAGVSLADLAAECGISKSGLFAHFRSKEELQLAVIEHADRIFFAEIVQPALEEPDGMPRLRALCEADLSYLERGVFAGGCFFAQAQHEFASLEGPVRDRLAAGQDAWLGQLEAAASAALHRGELRPDTDPRQLAFELVSILIGANWRWGMTRSPEAIERARSAVTTLMRAASR